MSAKIDTKISFIVPAYNVEKTIASCIESILVDIKCEETSVELLVVENGSDDSTQDIIKQYVKRYPEVVKMLIADKGVSKARNVGLKASRGTYIIFVDSDDLWLKGSLKKIETDNKECVDLSVYSYYKDNTYIKHRNDTTIVKRNNIVNCRTWMISEPTKRMQVWAKVFKSKIIQEYKIYFNESLSYSEDGDFMIEYTRYCKSVRISDKAIYRYMSDTESAMRSVNLNRTDEYIKALKESSRRIAGENEMIRKAFSKYLLAHLNIICVHDIFSVTNNQKFKTKVDTLRRLLQIDIFKKALQDISIKDCLTTSLIPELFYKVPLPVISCGGVICYAKSYLNRKHEKRVQSQSIR